MIKGDHVDVVAIGSKHSRLAQYRASMRKACRNKSLVAHSDCPEANKTLLNVESTSGFGEQCRLRDGTSRRIPELTFELSSASGSVEKPRIGRLLVRRPVAAVALVPQPLVLFTAGALAGALGEDAAVNSARYCTSVVRNAFRYCQTSTALMRIYAFATKLQWTLVLTECYTCRGTYQKTV